MKHLPVLAILFALSVSPAAAQHAGQQQFEQTCSGCHGLDGSGGGHGPAIVGAPKLRAATQDAVRTVIQKGIPDAGMPAFPLSDSEAGDIASYILRLRQPAATSSTTADVGDPAAGERLFNGKGNCTTCHMIHGRGGFFGPDLSNIGRDRAAAAIEQQLREPGSARPTGRNRPIFKAVSVKLKDGRTIRGIARNESDYDLQLLGMDYKLHLLTKDQVVTITREKSLMPKVDASPANVRNLVAYLSRLTSPAGIGSGALGLGVTLEEIIAPAPGSWPTYNGNVSGNRFSPLDQINAGNVAGLAPKWSFPVPGTSKGLQVTPVVVDGVMYVTAANEAFALDARSGREIWHFSRPRTQGLAGDAAGGINRGVAILGDRVFMVTDNAHLLALHRFTGQLIWETEMADSRQNYGATGAPLIVDDLVISGISGGDEGVRGFLAAYRASTGERVWRFWTIPAPGDPGSETWSGRAFEHGCGTTWLTGTFDPETHTLYWPTGNPCPDYNGDVRKGDNLYTSSVLALDPTTGKLKWHYQFTPHDVHDWDATETPILVNAKFHGEPRKLLLHGNRNGFFYVLDRITGKVLLAEPFVKKLTWASGIGPDGRPKLLPGNEPTAEGAVTCPAVEGAANWPSSAYHPATGLFYLFVEESCNTYTKRDQQWQAGKSYYGGGTRRAADDTGVATFLRALDIQTGKIAWEIPGIGGDILGSGLIATAGGLIFYGDGNGAFVSADAKGGKVLWHHNTGTGWRASPMTYTVDGSQYIGVAAGNTIMAFGLR